MKQKLFSLLVLSKQHQSGLSLPEVLIAAAVLGGMALVVAQMSGQVSSQNSAMVKKMDSNQFELIIGDQLSKEEACVGVFSNITADNNNAVTVGDYGQPITVSSKQLGPLNIVNQSLSVGDSYGQLKIEDYYLEKLQKDQSDSDTGYGDLVVKVSFQDTSTQRKNVETRIADINFQLNAQGQIEGCSSVSETGDTSCGYFSGSLNDDDHCENISLLGTTTNEGTINGGTLKAGILDGAFTSNANFVLTLDSAAKIKEGKLENMIFSGSQNTSDSNFSWDMSNGGEIKNGTIEDPDLDGPSFVVSDSIFDKLGTDDATMSTIKFKDSAGNTKTLKQKCINVVTPASGNGQTTARESSIYMDPGGKGNNQQDSFSYSCADNETAKNVNCVKKSAECGSPCEEGDNANQCNVISESANGATATCGTSNTKYPNDTDAPPGYSCAFQIKVDCEAPAEEGETEVCYLAIE